jgi:hypothetical protein
MVPADFKDWWLAAAAVSATLSTGAVAQQPEQAGVISASQGATRSFGVPGKRGESVIYMGEQTYRNEKLKNESGAVTHILFLDQSSLTIGPDAEITIDEFVYDPATKQGKISLNLVKGLVRVVGGDISKTNETLVKTPVGTIGIRGGITLVETNGQNTSGTFLFGQQMSATDTNGNTQTVTRSGFGTSFGGNQPPSTPERISVNQLNSQLNRLETRPGPGNGFVVQQPSPAPTGQLISTGSGAGAVTGGGLASPATLANDRLKNVVDTNAGANPTNFTKTLTGTGLVQNQS